MKVFWKCWVALLLCSITPSLKAQLAVSDTLPKFDLIQTLFGNGVTVTNLQVICDTSIAMWEFDGTNSNLGLTHGILLSTGEAQDAPGPNISGAISSGLGQPGYQPLTNLAGQNTFDACVIQFDIVPLCDSIAIRYVFASDEYNEYVNSINDIFAFFISGPGYGTPPPGENIALVPGTNIPVSINNVNNGNSPGASAGPCTNCAFFTDNVGGATIEYDGFTTPLLAEAAVQACQTYRITLAIADGSDGILDSGVFLEAGGIGCITPTLTLNAVNSTVLGANVAVEGCVNSGEFVFTLPQPLPDTTVFYYTVGGTATSGVDYAAFQDSIVMPAGDTVYTLPITIFGDNIIEGPETIELYYVDSSLCNNTIYRDTAVLEVWDKPEIPLLQDEAFCSASTITIGFDSMPGQTYNWTPALGLSDPTISNPDLTLTHQGTTSFTQTYYMVATAIQGFCIYVDSFEAEVFPANFSDFTVDSVCLGNETSFSSSTVFDVLVGWDWSLGDGISSTNADPIHTYADHGLYQATLIATNSKGCLDTVVQTVLVDSLPQLGYSVDPVCHTASSIFVNDIRPGTSYIWDLGDGNVSLAPSPVHIYGAPGDYLTQVIGTTARGCQDSISQTITVFANPIANFDFESQCFGQPIPFTNLTSPGTGKTLDYAWDFGDGANSSLEDPAYQYGEYGTRPVSLIATDEHGCTDNITKEVRTYALPIAEIQTDSACTGDVFELSDLSTVPDGSLIQFWRWESGDDRVYNGPNPAITYFEDGPYQVSLKVTSEFGCEDSTTGTVLARPLPTSHFSYKAVCALDSTPFVQLAYVERPSQNDSIQSWTWDWGDGQSSGAIERPGHVYAEGGTYYPTLTVETQYGCSNSGNQIVTVFDLPTEPAIKDDTVCFGDQAFLVAIPGAHTEVLNWYKTIDGMEPFHTGSAFATPPVLWEQTYFVEGISHYSCVGPRVEVTAYPYEPVESQLVLSASVVEIPNSLVSMSIASDREIVRYNWSFGDGVSSTDIAPNHSYANPGIYEIQVSLMDRYGCEEQLSGLVEVKQLITVFVPSGFTPNGDGVNDRFYIRTQLIESLRFEVFNRWGQRVFSTNSPDFVWDGMDLKGTPLEEGVYIYRFEAVDLRGETISDAGSITIVR